MTDREAMQQIMQVLGPSAVCRCQGCAYETDKAIELLNGQGIFYQFRKEVAKPKHDPEAEEEGNKVS